MDSVYRLVLIASAPCRRSPSCPNFGQMSTSPDPRVDGRKCFYVPEFQHEMSDLSTRRAQQIITAHMQLEDQGIGTVSNSSVPVLSKLERDLVSVFGCQGIEQVLGKTLQTLYHFKCEDHHHELLKTFVAFSRLDARA